MAKEKAKKTVKQPEFNVIEFPKTLLRALDDFSREYQRGIGIRLEEAMDDLNLKRPGVQVDMQRRVFLVPVDESGK